jgi:integrase
MSIRPHGNGKWIIDYYPLGRKGKRVRLTFNGTEAEAKIFETELRRQHAGLPNPVNPKIIDIIPEYLEWLKIHRAKKTYDDVFECLKRILPHFGHLQVRMITPSAINKYKEKRIGRICACNKELTYLSCIISWMSKHEPPYANPLPFRIEKIPYKKPLPRVPSIKDIERFLKEIKEPLKKTMILLMYQTGLRYSDMVFIRWENIDFNEKTIHLIQKGGGEKVIIMT